MQSDATEGTLIDNAVGAGFDKKDLEERIVSSEEYKAMIPIPEPASREETVADLRAVLVMKGVITAQDVAVDSSEVVVK